MMALLVVCAFAWNTLWPLLSHEETAAENVEALAEKLDPQGPSFDANQAFDYLKAQCNFGPRCMNTAAHDQCGEWIAKQFEALGCEVEKQHANLVGYDGTTLKATNIIARLNPSAESRILFCAHWDSRPWADNDPDEANWHKPVMAANDGASGVAVMLEMARVLSADSLFNKGIDFVCFDAEDWGTPQWSEQPDQADSWALGAQYFASQVNPAIYQFGVLLDMVGGQGAKFYRESFSMRYAGDVVKRIWRSARKAGFGSYFPKKDGGAVTDDHVPLCRRGIPVVDIIPYYPDCEESSFGPTWHTLMDDVEHIDPNTLRAVGQTMIQLLYE